MAFIPVSLVIHLALTSILSVTWAVVALRLFGIRHAAETRGSTGSRNGSHCET